MIKLTKSQLAHNLYHVSYHSVNVIRLAQSQMDHSAFCSSRWKVVSSNPYKTFPTDGKPTNINHIIKKLTSFSSLFSFRRRKVVDTSVRSASPTSTWPSTPAAALRRSATSCSRTTSTTGSTTQFCKSPSTSLSRRETQSFKGKRKGSFCSYSSFGITK